MKRIFFVLLLLFLVVFNNGPVLAGQEIVVVQGLRVRPYEQAIMGLESECNPEIKRLVVSESEEENIIEKINEIGPDIILAAGPKALSIVKQIRDIPVVYLMVLNPESILSGQENITGVSISLSPERQLVSFLKVLPDMKNIGLLYDPARTGRFVDAAGDAVRKMGIKLILKEVHRSNGVPISIEEMKSKIDAFWMMPDITVITPETVEYLLLFSLENKIPILTFSEKYVELGAFMSVGIDAFDIGRQAGEMAGKILSGRDVRSTGRVYARKAVITVNLKVAKKLGLSIDADTKTTVRIID
ncbi:MAG: ABC transporter substrate binding protein [Thermodesulfobacteriota bacterium]|nr:ABC transporter substrate binding protein [Thermodesulfobacteriota bacterium]